MKHYFVSLQILFSICFLTGCSDTNNSEYNSKTYSEYKFIEKEPTQNKAYSKKYFENGNIQSEGWLLNGNNTDWWIEYDREGNKLSEGHYIRGQRHGFFRFYMDKNTWKEGNFEHGEPVGAWQLYKSGKLRQILMNE